MVIDKSIICPVFIGRENDLQLLDWLIAQAEAGNGQFALISGEAGIGKSRLVKEAKARRSKGALILEGNSFQTDSALPYAPLLDLFRNFFAVQPSGEIVQAMQSSAPQLVKLFPELTAHLPHLTAAPNPDPRQEKQRLFQAFIQTITELARDQALIVVIEDLHWSDSTSLEFLLQLARRLPPQPILLLATYRSEETTPELTHLLAQLDRERLATEFALKRLSQQEVDTMLRAILDLKTPISKEFLDMIFPLTEGNPFFVEEILKALIAEGDIFYADGNWDRKEISQLRVPRTIQDAVQRRTQQLDKPTLQALTLASVMGRRFDFRLLQELLAVEEQDLLKMLKKLVEAQLVIEETADQYAFRHALTREAIYSALLLRERQGLHRSVGEAIERLYTSSTETHIADLSFHYYTGGAWQKTLKYSHKAGDQAQTLYAPREAIVYYSRALAAVRKLNAAASPELLSARGHAYETLGDFKSALDDFEETLSLARQGQDGHAEWQTLVDLGFLWAGRDYQQTGEYFRRAEELSRRLHKPILQAQSLNRLGNWSVNVGQTLQGLKSHYQALEIFEQAEDEQGMADTHDLLGMAAMHHGDQVGSYDEYQYAIHLFRKLDDKHGLASALIGAYNASCWDETVITSAESRVEKQHMIVEALELTRQTGWTAGQAFTEWSAAVGLANQGFFGEALTHADESLRIATEIEHRQWITAAYYALGHAYVLMLQANLAIRNLEQGLTRAKELGSAWWIGNITTDLANAHLLNGDPEQAHSLLESAMQKTNDRHTLPERRMLWAKGNLLLAENEPEQALQIAERLFDSQPRSADHVIPALMKLQGEALLRLKRWDQATEALEGAKRGAERREALPILWQIRCLLGGVYKEQKDLEKAEREFAEARQVLSRLEANIQDEQLRAGFIQKVFESMPKGRQVSRRQSEAEKFGGLTPREREVARCLSLGHSNREIAEELVLSERTVENHVGNILKKLGFDSRSQVAIWVVERGLLEKN
ncbi:MAG TPA: AAA family ATPase [Anaerolineales bacterium]|nr:AAA family ATPase [Anaerolineales bacterium]